MNKCIKLVLKTKAHKKPYLVVIYDTNTTINKIQKISKQISRNNFKIKPIAVLRYSIDT